MQFDMTQLSFLLFILFNASVVRGQETVPVTNLFAGSQQPEESYSVLKSDRTTRHGEYIAYFRAPKEEYKRIRKIKSNYYQYIREKGNYLNGKREGDWIVYASPGVIESEGKYLNDKKSGIWTFPKEQGQVTERYDFDRNKKLPPRITVVLQYPATARKSGIEGRVAVTYNVNEDCSITDLKVVKSLSHACDSTMIDGMQRYAKLYKVYGVDCAERIDSHEFEFTLDD